MSNLCTVNSLRGELYQNGVSGYKELITVGVMYRNYHLITSQQLRKRGNDGDQGTVMCGKLARNIAGRPPPPPRSYPYFDVVVGLVWSHDPKSYAGGSVRYW
jgi:hypothetical protein